MSKIDSGKSLMELDSEAMPKSLEVSPSRD